MDRNVICKTVPECNWCCNDKVYVVAMNQMSNDQVLEVDIVVNDKEVVISLLPFVECPYPTFRLATCFRYFLKGSNTELFLIIIRCSRVITNTIFAVHLYKFNMTSMMREETEDLSDAIFFVDLACEYSIFYRSTIAYELGGHIHIRDKSGQVIYSYHVKDKTISPSSMPCQSRCGKCPNSA